MANTNVNYYAELGLDRAASVEQLEAELKALRKKWINRQNAADTDKRQKAERMVELIREATEILMDPEKKKKYDKELDKRGETSTPARQEEDRPMSNAYALEGAALLDAMEAYYEDGKYNMAIAACNQALNSGVTTVDVFRYLMLSYIEKGDNGSALKAISNMVSYNADDPDAHLLAAKALLRLIPGHARDARVYLDKLYEDGYGENSDVAALDVEYYIDTDNLPLAEEKTNAYLANHSNDTSFKSSISNAYVQYAEEHHTVQVGGDWYIDSEASFSAFEKCINRSLALEPDTKLNNMMKKLKKRQLVPGSWVSWGSCFLYAFGGFGAELPMVGVLSLILGVALLFFSMVPNWMVERYQYHNHLCGLYEVARIIGNVASFIWRISWAIVKFIFALVFHLSF